MDLRDITDRLLETYPINGIAEVIGQGYIIDWAEEPTDEARQAAEGLLAELVTTPEINWTGLLAEFLQPGNTLYEACLSQAMAAGPLAYHRFSNLQQVISNPTLRSPQGVAFGIGQLNGALIGENALTNAEKTAWNSLMDAHALPVYCKLPV